MMVLDYRGQAQLCVVGWWARPSPKPYKALSLPPPRLMVCHPISQSPLYWPVASCSQSDLEFTLWGISCTHTHTSSRPPLFTPSSRKGGKEEENSREWIGVGCDLYTTKVPHPTACVSSTSQQMEQIDRIMFTHPGLEKQLSCCLKLGVWNVFFLLWMEFGCIEEPMA